MSTFDLLNTPPTTEKYSVVAAFTTNWRSAGSTLLSIQVAEAVEAIGKVIS